MLIGFLGQSGSGKTTASQELARSTDARILSVAAPIRAMLLSLGLQQDDFDVRSKERVIGWIGKSPRQLMQSLGDWGRDNSPHLWSTLLDARLAEAWDGHLPRPVPKGTKPPKAKPMPYVLVDDIRLPLEAACIRKRGGLLVRVTRPKRRQNDSSHFTERAGQLIDVDYEVVNDGSPKDLLADLEGWLYGFTK